MTLHERVSELANTLLTDSSRLWGEAMALDITDPRRVELRSSSNAYHAVAMKVLDTILADTRDTLYGTCGTARGK
jgi:hypothetical protein